MFTFNPIVPYEQAVISDNNALRELARKAAASREPNTGAGNIATRGAFRKQREPVIVFANSVGGGNAGKRGHPDRTTEPLLYNELIDDLNTKDEWQGFKKIPPNTFEEILTDVDSSRKSLETYRKNFDNLGYHTELFSELHPCPTEGGYQGCEPFLKGTLNPGKDVVHHAIKYGLGYESRIKKGHLAALQAMDINPNSYPPLPPSMLGRHRPPEFQLPTTFVPTHIPSQSALSLLRTPTVQDWSPEAAFEQKEQHERREEDRRTPTITLPFLGLNRPRRGGKILNRSQFLATAPTNDDDEEHSDPPSFRDRSRSPVRRERSSSPLRRYNPDDYEPPFTLGQPNPDNSDSDDDGLPFSLRQKTPPFRERPPLHSELASELDDILTYANKFESQYKKRGGPVTSPKAYGKKSHYQNPSRGMNIYERMLLGYV